MDDSNHVGGHAKGVFASQRIPFSDYAAAKKTKLSFKGESSKMYTISSVQGTDYPHNIPPDLALSEQLTPLTVATGSSCLESRKGCPHG